MTDFTSLSLAAPIAKAVAAEGYTTPTPIQRQSIPLVLAGRDLLGVAQTGTGKTAAFALPILDRLAKRPIAAPPRGVRALVLAPTRELAGQIADAFETYGRFLKVSVAAVFGGAPINRQIRRLEGGLDVLVATPGRLLDLIERRAVRLNDVEVLVLDEADQMLDLGFIHALRRILPLLPASRQTLLFSATMPRAIAELAERYLRDPAKVAVTPVATTAERVAQRAILASPAMKPPLLARLLSAPDVTRALVFTRTKHGADRVVRQLAIAGIVAIAIHGNKSQPQRLRALEAFRSGRARVLVATDIAARGIDVDGVSHVINYDVPNVPEQYVHRIGRTARAGASGLAIALVSDEERAFLRDIEKLTRQTIPLEPTPADLPKPAAARPSAPAADPAASKRVGQGKRAAAPVSGALANGERDPQRKPNRRRRPGPGKPRAAGGAARRPAAER